MGYHISKKIDDSDFLARTVHDKGAHGKKQASSRDLEVVQYEETFKTIYLVHSNNDGHCGMDKTW